MIPKNKKLISVYLDKEIAEWVKQQADEKDRTKTKICSMIIKKEYLAAMGKKQ